MKLLTTLTLLFAYGLLTPIANAEWDNGSGAGGFEDHYEGQVPSNGGYHQPNMGYPVTLRQTLNQHTSGRQSLSLRSILGMGPQYDGRIVQEVVIRAGSNGYAAGASLVLNGMQASMYQTLGAWNQEYRLVPNLVGSNAYLQAGYDSLKLVLDGEVDIESVSVTLSGGVSPNPYNPNLYTQYLGQTRVTNSSLNLGQLLRLPYGIENSLNSVEYVVIKARTDLSGYAALVSLTLDGYSVSLSQQIGAYELDLILVPTLGRRISTYDLNRLNIQIQGSALVTSVGVKLRTDSYHPVPNPYPAPVPYYPQPHPGPYRPDRPLPGGGGVRPVPVHPPYHHGGGHHNGGRPDRPAPGRH